VAQIIPKLPLMNIILRQTNLTDRLSFIFLLLVYLISIYLDQTDRLYFDTKFAQEDGFIENLTALGLFLIPCILIYRLIKLWKQKKISWKIGLLAMSMVFLFGAAEEISWGQRLLGIEPGEFFTENNAQKETNFHNLVVGETKVNKLIFSKLMFIALFIYFVIFPYLYSKKKMVLSLSTQFAIPVAKIPHIIFFIFYTILVLFLGSSRNWEVLELMFAIIFFLIFQKPQNYREIYQSRQLGTQRK